MKVQKEYMGVGGAAVKAVDTEKFLEPTVRSPIKL